VLAELNKAGLAPLEDFPGRLRRRRVRIVELLGALAMIQPLDDPRSWEIAPTDLITVNPDDVRTQPRPDTTNAAYSDIPANGTAGVRSSSKGRL
jgi:hypothetical protein